MGDLETLDAEMTEDEEQDTEGAMKSTPATSAVRSYNPDDDPELAEMLRSAVDMAVSILREGREIQKISVIRTLPDLLDGHGQECIDKVLPLVQEVLHVESTNLDMHCEGAVSFRNILANRALCASLPSIADEILKGILVNLNRQKDNLSAAAWLETLIDVVDHIPLDAVRYEVLPVVLSQADASQRVQRRVIASKLLEKLCSVLGPADVKADLAPCAQMLCQDSNANVRSAIGQRLPAIAKSLGSASDSVTLILPCLIELCKDEDAGVREAILNTVGACMPYFDRESLQEIIVPLLRKCSEQSYRIGDETLTAVAKNLGSWCYNLREVLSPQDRAWFLSMYTRLAGVDDSQQQPANRARQGPLPLMTQSDPEGLSLLEPAGAEDSGHVACRRMCAYNFPCMVMMFGTEAFRDTLQPILEALCVDPDEAVRCAIAAGFHEVVVLLPDEVSLIAAFVELIRGGEVDVVGQLTKRMDRILPSLYKCAHRLEQPDTNGNVQSGHKSQLDRILMACNRLIRGTGAWRNHEAFLRNVACIGQVVSGDDLHVAFVPMLKEEILTARALPCRIAAAETLLLFLRDTESLRRRQAIIDFFVQSLCMHQSCHKRKLFLDVVGAILRLFSRVFFKANFLSPTLKLADDKVSNIRLKLCKLLPKLKQALVIPGDEQLLVQIERVVREMLSKELNANNRHLIQSYACELSRAETGSPDDVEDKKREALERERWDGKPSTGPPKPPLPTMRDSSDSGSRPPAVPRRSTIQPPQSTSRLRLQRPKTAVVRPQPQVVVTKRSPSPMPMNFISKEPMERYDYEKENENRMNALKPPTPSRTRVTEVTNSPGGRYSVQRPAATMTQRTALSSPSTVTASTAALGRPRSFSATTQRKDVSNTPIQNTTKTTITLAQLAANNSNNNNGRSAIPVSGWRRPTSSVSSISSIGLQPSKSSAYVANRSSSTLRRSPYGLVKVQSSSAIERKPCQMSFRVSGHT